MTLFNLKDSHLLGKLVLAHPELSAVDAGWINTCPTLNTDFYFYLVRWIIMLFENVSSKTLNEI